MPEAPDLVSQIAELIEEKFLVRPASAEDDLVHSGVVDSLTLIQLLVHLEQRFAVTIPLIDLDVEDIRSVRSLARLVDGRRLAATAGIAS